MRDDVTRAMGWAPWRWAAAVVAWSRVAWCGDFSDGIGPVVASEVGTVECHPMHGLSNRILGLASALQLGALLDPRVAVDWRLDDSKFVGAPLRELFNVSRLPPRLEVSRAAHPKAKASEWAGRCDAFYMQRGSGWHTSNADGRGGGFGGPSPGAAFLAHLARAAPDCNDTEVTISHARRASNRRMRNC